MATSVCVCVAGELSFIHLEFEKSMDHPVKDSKCIVVDAGVELIREI